MHANEHTLVIIGKWLATLVECHYPVCAHASSIDYEFDKWQSGRRGGRGWGREVWDDADLGSHLQGAHRSRGVPQVPPRPDSPPLSRGARFTWDASSCRHGNTCAAHLTLQHT